MVEQQNPERFRELTAAAEAHASRRFSLYDQLARLHFGGPSNGNRHSAEDAAAALTTAPTVAAVAAAALPAPAPAAPAATAMTSAAPADPRGEVCSATGGGCYMRRSGHLGVSAWR